MPTKHKYSPDTERVLAFLQTARATRGELEVQLGLSRRTVQLALLSLERAHLIARAGKRSSTAGGPAWVVFEAAAPAAMDDLNGERKVFDFSALVAALGPWGWRPTMGAAGLLVRCDGARFCASGTR